MATPTLDPTIITEIFSHQANADSSVVSDGGETITERGFVYSESTNPIV